MTILTKRSNFKLILNEYTSEIVLDTDLQQLSSTDGSIVETVKCPNTIRIPLEYDESTDSYTIRVTSEALRDIVSAVNGWIGSK